MTQARRRGVFVVASYMRDLGVRVDRFPQPGETRAGDDFLESAGGKGSNQAIQAARCGAPVVLVAALGQDAAGDQACAIWRAEGIDARSVHRQAGEASGHALIIVDARGENQIVIAPGANRALRPEHLAIAAPAIGGAAVVLSQLETPLPATLRAFELARAAGATTLLNSAPAPQSLPDTLWALTDILVANELEAATLAGCPADSDPREMGARLLHRVRRGVVITLGEHGAIWFEAGADPRHQPAPTVTVVDSTGAGDAFVGAFAAAWAAGLRPAQALARGVAAGSLACTARGVVPALARGDAIDALAARSLDESAG